jgi:hypothetical protein
MNDQIQRWVTETTLDLPAPYINSLNKHIHVITIESQCIQTLTSKPNQPVHQVKEDNAIQPIER